MNRMTSTLISAPRPSSVHRLAIMSIFAIIATPVQAAKNDSPLVMMDVLLLSTLIWIARTGVSPFCSSSRNREVIRIA